MSHAITAFIKRLGNDDSLMFEETMDLIDSHYSHTPTAFKNGLGDDAVDNAADQNQGSCKLFAFAQLQQLDGQQTLAAFGQHYRHVLQDLDGKDHANIRNFMRDGWAGIAFENSPLSANQ